mgnify:CR=1 FL=1
MGYRSRLGRVAKVERDRYLNRSHEECTEILEQRYPNECPALYRPPFHEQFIELGKYCEFAITPEPFYNGFNLEEAEECEFHILPKEGLKQIQTHVSRPPFPATPARMRPDAPRHGPAYQ